MSEWKELKGPMELGEIEDFAKKIFKLSRKYNCNFLEKYASDLLGFTDAFDIEQIEFSLNDFPKICNKIEGGN